MRLWPKSNYRKILDKFVEIEKVVRGFKEALYDLEEIKEGQKEVKAKENKLIIALESENKMLRNELAHKNRFIESLLAQMLGQVSVKTLNGHMEPKKEEKLPTTMSAAERWKEMKKNGKSLPLP